MIAHVERFWRVKIPLWLQVFLLLLAALILMQALTIFVFFRLPPPRPQLVSITAIAQALSSGRAPRNARLIVVETAQGAPRFDTKSLSSDSETRRAIAAALHVAPEQVQYRHLRGPGSPFFVLAGEPARHPIGPGAGPPPWPLPSPGFELRGPEQRPPAPPMARGSSPFLTRFRQPWEPNFVSGEFSAALKTPNGEWRVVHTQRGAFTYEAQRHFLLWAAFAFAIAAPAGLLFARSIAAPVLNFARACDAIGKDPNAAPIQIRSGPAEISAAASAFHTMHMRLQRLFLHQQGILSVISHDLRGPLARLKFQADEWPAPYRDTTMNNIAELERVLSGIIDASRREAGFRRIALLDLRTLLHESCGRFGAAAELHAAEAIFIEGDAHALERMFHNLIDNAVKYGERAVVRLERRTAEVLVTIEDDGPGLPDEALETAFQPFERHASTATSNPDGLGIGLTAARSIARAHGGEVALARGRQQGLQAITRLPLRQL